MAQIGNYDNILLLLFRQLALHLKSTDALHFIPKKIYTERELGRKRKNIDNATAYGILSRFVHVVHILETVTTQYFRNKVHIDLLTQMEFQGLVSQLLTGNDLLSQRIRIGNHAKSLLSFLQAAQHFRTENFVCSIFLPILYGATERRGEKQYLFRSQNLCQVMIEIPRFLQIAENKNKRTFHPLYQYGRKQ